jgi:RNA polymerase sigma-70 factor (ECF subfamily)
MSDERILSIMKVQPERGVEMLVSQYSSLLYTVIMRILGKENANDIEECVSDTFLKFWQTADRYDPSKGCVKNYLVIIARNLAINRFHQINKVEIFSIDELTLNGNEFVEELMLDHMDRDLVRRVLKSLKPIERTIMIRRYYLCYKVKEIADSLNKDEIFVKNKLSRCRKNMKDMIMRYMIDNQELSTGSKPEYSGSKIGTFEMEDNK